MSEGLSIVGRTAWLLRQFRKQIWVRAVLFSLAAVGVAILAALVGPYLPDDAKLKLAAGSVDHILNILASSMLAVTTFSLSVMVSAYSSATSNVTPRSTKLLVADSTAQNTLATFIGSFLFSVVGIIGLAAGLYGDNGRILLFAATLVVIFLIAATLLRWIEQLSRFGRVGDTILRVEDAATPAFTEAGIRPRLGAMPSVDPPASALPVFSTRSGMIQHIDVAELNCLAEAHDGQVFVQAMPGALVHPRRALLTFDGALDDALTEQLCTCVSVGDDREFEQDPRFGLIVLSEIASRALSPAVNDPGTAIEVLRSGLRTLLAYADAREQLEAPRWPRVFAPELDTADLFRSFFGPIARDGSTLVEVHMRILAVLDALAARAPETFCPAVRDTAQRTLDRALTGLTAPDERNLIQARAEQLLTKIESREGST